MHTVQLNIDDSVFDEFMELLNKLPKSKLEVTSDAEFPGVAFEKTIYDTSSREFCINELLKEHNLSHFTYDDNMSRIVYTYGTGTPQQKHDFVRLKAILREKNIRHTDIGLDVIIIEKD
ncbi:MAG: hypothetical protein OQK48_02710 [Sulfurimonas sp.]|uniref:hypothetical protein n=1 Tax=Sulfurimonas sp. TaxID=2022749 RepID=UPI00261E2AD6|nr:hypothetical protein [Sulfurimonas sp.]MCW8895451.1 hypothetical protein [Sulfurimonas sp.]MCW8953835.1 hypothetical protein [Sulfurimonas sp.]MCW9067394.1 hypothetical protein [Sulfurimonas sp.]